MSTSSHETQARSSRLLLILAVVAVVLLVVGYSLLPANVHFRIFHDEASFNRFMSSQVRPTATIEELQRSLGDGKVVTERDRQKLLATVQDFCRQTPQSYPDRVDADDQFVGYDLGGHTTYLQFREGVLINFTPREYGGPLQFKAVHP